MSLVALLNANVNLDDMIDNTDIEILSNYLVGMDGFTSLPIKY